MSESGAAPSRGADVSGWSERDILAAAQELAHVGAWSLLPGSGEVWWSDETYRILGHSPGEFGPSLQRYLEAVHPDDRDEIEASVVAALAGADTWDARHRVVWPDGSLRYVRARGYATRTDEGTPERLTGAVIDITADTLLEQERDTAVRALAAGEERYRLLAENAWDVIWTMGVDGTITYVSPSVERVRGITPDEAAAQTLDQIHPQESAAKVTAYFAELYDAMAAGAVPPVYHGEREYYRKDGSIMLGELQVIPQVDSDGTVVQILGVTRDISERRRLEDELNRLAVTDPLTGIWNRRRGEWLMSADLAEESGDSPPMSLLMVDIDHFKSVNDSHGHHVGDRVLVQLTHLISSRLRSSDMLVRWGGEEFVIFMRRCSLDDAVSRAEALREVIEATEFDNVGRVTVSIGAAQVHAAEGFEASLHRADVAMYAAKAQGRNAVMASE